MNPGSFEREGGGGETFGFKFLLLDQLSKAFVQLFFFEASKFKIVVELREEGRLLALFFFVGGGGEGGFKFLLLDQLSKAFVQLFSSRLPGLR